MATFATRKHVLLVEPDSRFRSMVAEALSGLARADVCADFDAGRRQLTSRRFDLLVANIRLEAYNGLHLVYLSQSTGAAPHAVAYSDARSPGLAYEAQRAGAFYEPRERLIVSLPGYLYGNLPPVDRRHPIVVDRRSNFRGGRRRWDLYLMAG